MNNEYKELKKVSGCIAIFKNIGGGRLFSWKPAKNVEGIIDLEIFYFNSTIL